jgi:hypothetical protein
VSSSESNSGLTAIPKGYIAIAISEDQTASALKICVLVRSEPDSVGGHLVLLRETIDARVFLGCIVDASGQVLEWLELWVQNTETLINAASAIRHSLSNSMLDNRWRRQSQGFNNLDGAVTVATGWESEHPLPTFLDISTHSPLHPVDPGSGAHWRLCVDEGLLQQKDLPGYCGSLHRYLYIPELRQESPLVPVTSGAPTNDSTKPLSEICGETSHIIPFNPGAGLMLVKKHFTIGLEAFTDILSGAAWDGFKHGRSIIDFGKQLNALRKDEAVLTADGRLFLEAHGQCGRLIETFHLKLRLLADIVSSVRSMVRHLQRPLLNISPESWQVQLGEPGRGLPYLWTARAVLSDPGDAIPLAIENSDLKYFLPALESGTSIYRPLAGSISPSAGWFYLSKRKGIGSHTPGSAR